jgi:glycosyltransferase involved in cell wall biosynthesis
VLISKVSNSHQPLFAKLRYIFGALLRGRCDLGYWAKTDRNKEQDPEYKICLNADKLLSPSIALKKWVIGYWQLPEHKIKLLPNPFTAEKHLFSTPIENRAAIICFVGKLTVLKGMIRFTPAIKQILLRFPEYKVVIAGRDEAANINIPSVKAWMLKQLEPLKDRVVFTGAVNKEQVLELLTLSQVCIVPSLWENYPNVVLESMAAGCALAASDTGGIPELIENKKTGMLFNPRKVSSIINAVHLLLHDQPKRLQLAAAARESLYKYQYSSKLSKDLDAFYRSVNVSEPVIRESF